MLCLVVCWWCLVVLVCESVWSSLYCCWWRQGWRRCVGCCVVVTVRIYLHYGFNSSEKIRPASNYEYYGILTTHFCNHFRRDGILFFSLHMQILGIHRVHAFAQTLSVRIHTHGDVWSTGFEPSCAQLVKCSKVLICQFHLLLCRQKSL